MTGPPPRDQDTELVNSTSTLRLYRGNAASVLRQHVATATVDLAYIDPPFGNRQIWTGKAGSFSDRHARSPTSQAGWKDLARHNPAGCELLSLIVRGESDHSYIGVIAGVLIEVRRALRLTGTLWLHFDDTMGAPLRILGDVIFGPRNSLGTCIWKRATAHNSSGGRRFGRVHDTIACWARSRASRWRLWRIGQVGGDPCTDEPPIIGGVFDDSIGPMSSERIGYPTQKPVRLIQHFIRAATLPGSVVLDPMCGSGTALIAAMALDRKAIGCDVSRDAIAATKSRLPALTLFDLDR